jgi:hypothetical protein
MGPHPDRERIEASYREALDAIARLSPGITEWDAPTPCGEWRLLDLSGHLLAIARYWLRLLDAAEAGHPCTELPRGRALGEMNARDLSGLADEDGVRRMHLFVDLAAEHLRRLETADWSITLGEWSGLGPLTLGQHSGVAIGEWHVHAWDMARALGADHRPGDAEIVAQGNRVVREISGDIDPWEAVLSGYARDLGWVAPPT